MLNFFIRMRTRVQYFSKYKCDRETQLQGNYMTEIWFEPLFFSPQFSSLYVTISSLL